MAIYGEEEEEELPPEVNKYKKASQSVKTALRGIEFIAQHIKNADKDNEVSHNTMKFIDPIGCCVSRDRAVDLSDCFNWQWTVLL